MNQASAAESPIDDSAAAAPANVSLKGTTRGMEILISGSPSPEALGARLTELLAEAPGFFAGCDARVAVEGALPSGALACLEEVVAQFDVRIVEVGPAKARRRLPAPGVLRSEHIPHASLAEGTGPIAEEKPLADAVGEPAAAAAADAANAPAADGVPTEAAPDVALANTAPYSVVALIDQLSSAAAGNAAAVPTRAPTAHPVLFPQAATASLGELAAAAASLPAAPAAPPAPPAPAAPAGPAAPPAAEAAAEPAPPGPRLVVGPVRSGVIVDHAGHVVVLGDVNPGAEVRAEGSIIVLGRLRGVAHAAIGRTAGFIIALSLQPQQLRIGRMVARAADADRPGDGAEIAYATGETIVVERFNGRLPSGLAASM